MIVHIKSVYSSIQFGDFPPMFWQTEVSFGEQKDQNAREC